MPIFGSCGESAVAKARGNFGIVLLVRELMPQLLDILITVVAFLLPIPLLAWLDSPKLAE